MKRASLLGQFMVRHTSSVCMVGAVLGAIYGFLIWIWFLVVDPIRRATTFSVLHFDLGQLLIFVIFALCFVGLLVAMLGGVFGGVLGMAAGLVSGLLLGPLTVVMYYPPAEYRSYRLIVGLISAIAAIATTYVLVFYMLIPGLHPEPSQERTPSLLAFLLSPAPIAGFGTWWASRFVARWYQEELPAQQAGTDSLGRETAGNAYEVPRKETSSYLSQ